MFIIINILTLSVFTLQAIEETILFKKPFVVREIKGIIKTRDGEFSWDKINDFLVFELTGPGDSGKKWIIKLDKHGRFKQKVPEGKYTFEIRITGWDDAMGTIIVTKKAKKKAKIDITLGLS
jgi:hypothetical protein